MSCWSAMLGNVPYWGRSNLCIGICCSIPYSEGTVQPCPLYRQTQSICTLRQSKPIAACTTHTHPFNGPLSRTTRVSRYQKCKTNLFFTEARDSEWQWHQLGHMQFCTSLQTDNHAITPPLSFYRPDALPAAQPTASKHRRQIVACTTTSVTKQHKSSQKLQPVYSCKWHVNCLQCFDVVGWVTGRASGL